MLKKRWEKPELIILLRGNLEENVLALCKDFDAPTSGPQTWNGWCVTKDTKCNVCLYNANT